MIRMWESFMAGSTKVQSWSEHLLTSHCWNKSTCTDRQTDRRSEAVRVNGVRVAPSTSEISCFKGFPLRMSVNSCSTAQYISAFFVSIIRSSRQSAEGTATRLRNRKPEESCFNSRKGSTQHPIQLAVKVKNHWNYSLRALCCMCPWRAHGQIYLLPSISYMYARTINAYTATLQYGIIV